MVYSKTWRLHGANQHFNLRIFNDNQITKCVALDYKLSSFSITVDLGP